MKKTYNIPTMKIKTFLTESVVTVSGDPEPPKTVDEKLNAYLSEKNIQAYNTVSLTW